MNLWKFHHGRWAASVVALALAWTPMTTATAQPMAAPVVAPAAEYRLGAGDLMRIVVYQNPDLTLETRVSDSGIVSFPLLGPVQLGGLTVTEAERVIADGLRKGDFVKQPQVTIVLTLVRGSQASVLGQVNRPGRYPIEVAGLRLSELLALAGGSSAGGAEWVVVTGVREGKPFRVEVDLPQLFSAEGRGKDLPIASGDIVWVDRQPLIYIYGEVQRPGSMRLERGMTLMQALAAGGGLTLRGTERGIRVHRQMPDGSTQRLTPSLDDRLQPSDVVYVRESLL